MSAEDDFKAKFYSAATTIGKVKLCISEGRYKIATRRDKPNLNGAEYLKPILNLPGNHPHKVDQRKSAGPGKHHVVSFQYQAVIMGVELTIYFKGYFGPDDCLRLEIQSLRDSKEG